MRRHVHSANHAAESFVSFIPLFDGTAASILDAEVSVDRLQQRVFAIVLAAAAATTVLASDARFVRAWEAAQREKPAQLSSSSRIAPIGEPGQPLVVRGTVLLPNQQRAAGVILFAYHTDNRGLYSDAGDTLHWRLKGWAAADSAGHFEFSTIRPAPYPNNSTPAHIHLSLVTSCCGRQLAELMFDDDPLATPQFRSHFAEVGQHGLYARTESAGGVQHVAFTIQLRPRGDF
jgi:protocatechuate 3,4-dioxygenase beta subunit